MNDGPLTQDDIDVLMNFRSVNTEIAPQVVKTKQGQEVIQYREYQTTYPIYYYGSTKPDAIVLRTTLEYLEPRTGVWHFHSYSEKLLYQNFHREDH
jgi:hypothetical protein